MDLAIIGLTILGLLILFLGSSVWVGVSLLLVGFFSFTLFTNNDPLQVLSNIAWNETNSYTMMTLPLFVFMGEVLFRSKVSDNLFKGLTPWISFLPGKLIHVNILSSTLFAAVSGSSAATTATVGKITLPEQKERGYNKALSIGTLAGAGTLGFLIPPSMMMVVYGIAANVSIGQLFIAGIIPGILIAIGLMGYTVVRSLFIPKSTTDDDIYTWS